MKMVKLSYSYIRPTELKLKWSGKWYQINAPPFSCCVATNDNGL